MIIAFAFSLEACQPLADQKDIQSFFHRSKLLYRLMTVATIRSDDDRLLASIQVSCFSTCYIAVLNIVIRQRNLQHLYMPHPVSL